MSEEVYYRGRLIPTGKTLKEYSPESSDIYDLEDEEFVEVDGFLYKVEKDPVDIYDDIFRSTKNEDGTIDFEVKYHNGGCGFNDAIDYALSSDD